MTIRAEPFTPLPVEKFNYIVDKCIQHSPWFHDYISDEITKRLAVISYLVDAYQYGKAYECWRDDALVGILLLNELVPFLDGRCHFLFFDSSLSDKYQLCLTLMKSAFEQVPVEVLRVEVPTYAKALLKFIRKLGFRYEAEGRSYSWPTNATPLSADAAKLGSRKHKATLYKGSWHDVLLLSITAEEFALQEHTRGSQDQQSTKQPDRPSAVPHPAGA